MLSVSVFLERVIAVFIILLTVSQPSLHVPSSKMPFQLQMLHPDLIMPWNFILLQNNIHEP